jgi:class 3 adenylate cyclase/tetratricopeptide (TPR) repeat protein
VTAVPGCPRCEAVNPEGYRFCGRCGAPLAAVTCPSCGTPNPEGQPFCGACGVQISAVAVAGEGPGSAAGSPTDSPLEERKLATVLFADVVGFTSLAERTDPEVVTRMVDSAFLELGRVVAEHGGTVDKYMGDSLMAVFGVPVAHDDDAERAVAAALAMRRLGGDLVFAIGVNSGEVMVSAVGRGDVTVIGDTVNVAARLEKAAAPGEVLCGRLTAELSGHRVELEERRPVVLKGKSEPVEVFAALRLRRGGKPDEGERPPLVGREEELSFLDMQWRRVRDEAQAALVVVCGEAGSGKTRLLDELADVVAGHGLVIRASYPAYGVEGGWQVAAELIDQLGPSTDPEVEMRVRSVVGDLDPSLRALDAVAMEREQLWGLGRLVKEKAAGRPLAVLVDDLHWGDERTLELLGQLAVRLRDLPLLTVVAGRTDPAEWLARFTTATTLRLRPLGRNQTEALAEALVGGCLTDDARRFFTDMAKGNPLYLRELVAMARHRDLLVQADGRYELTADRAVPATLQALLASRLDALDRAQKTVLQQLAVLGEATERELAELAERDCGAVLAALGQSGLVRLGADGRYEAADPLLGEVAYDMLPRAARGELHRRAAAAVDRSEARVLHLERAADYLGDDPSVSADATEALVAEARVLVEGFRPLDAIRLLQRAVALGMRRPDVLLDLGRLQGQCGKEDDALATLALVPDDPADPAQAVERDHSAANAKTFTDPGWAVPRLEEAARRWHALGQVEKEAWAHANAGVAYFYLSRMAESSTALLRGLELFESIGDRAGAVSTESFLCLARPSDPRVEQWLNDALQFANETGDRNRQGATLTTLTWRHFFQSMLGSEQDTQQAERLARRLSSLSEEMGALDIAIHGHSLRAVMTRLTGRFDAAREEALALARLLDPVRRHNENWLAWAAGFAVTLAVDSAEAAAPFPPEDSVDPIVTMSGVMVELALALAGRPEEAVARRLQQRQSFEGPIGDRSGIVPALALVLAGREAEAVPWLERAGDAVRGVQAPAVQRAAEAINAEVEGRAPEFDADLSQLSIAEALVLRAHALAGDQKAKAELRRMADALAAPGLLIGLT